MNLHLVLTYQYYDEIERGDKTEEYRRVTPYWQRRLAGREYAGISLQRGYTSTRQYFPWHGYEIKTIVHPHFGTEPVEVYTIKLEK